jgi:hypothetical protein
VRDCDRLPPRLSILSRTVQQVSFALHSALTEQRRALVLGVEEIVVVSPQAIRVAVRRKMIAVIFIDVCSPLLVLMCYWFLASKNDSQS